MLGFVRSACLCGAFACLVSFPTDGPAARLRGLPVAPPRRVPRATAPACGDGGGSVVRVASQSSQQGSSALLRKVHAAHAHCKPSAGPRCPSTPPPPKPSLSLVATPATVPAPISKQLSASPPRAAATAKSATVAAPPTPPTPPTLPTLPTPPTPPTLPTPRPRKQAIIPAAAASAGTNWPAPRERPPTPSAPAAVVCKARMLWYVVRAAQ